MLLPYCLFRNHTFYKFMGTGRQQPRILIANISYPIYNFPMSSTGEAIIAFCNYATPRCLSSEHGYQSTSCSKKNNCKLWSLKPTNQYTNRS